MIGRKTRVDLRIDADTIARAQALVPLLGEGATASDAYRVALARGLSWIEAHGPVAEVPPGPVTVKRAKALGRKGAER